MKRLLLAVVVVAASCASNGPAAPAPGSPDVACVDDFCIVYPGDWEAAPGVGYVSFTHPTAPDRAMATISILNMEGVVVNAGGVWPTTPDEVARAFWQLLEEAEVADLVRLERRVGGSVESFGSYQDGRLWHLLIPVDATRAIGVEVRGPNNSWETHADVFFSNVTGP